MKGGRVPDRFRRLIMVSISLSLSAVMTVVGQYLDIVAHVSTRPFFVYCTKEDDCNK